MCGPLMISQASGSSAVSLMDRRVFWDSSPPILIYRWSAGWSCLQLEASTWQQEILMPSSGGGSTWLPCDSDLLAVRVLQYFETRINLSISDRLVCANQLPNAFSLAATNAGWDVSLRRLNLELQPVFGRRSTTEPSCYFSIHSLPARPLVASQWYASQWMA